MKILIRGLNFILKRAGYKIRKSNPDLPGVFNPNSDQIFMPLYNTVKNNTMLSVKRMYNLHQIVKYLNKAGVQGNFIECGVWKGGAVGMMAATTKTVVPRNLFLFDVFDDIGQPDHTVDGKNAIKFVKGKANAQGKMESVKDIYESKGGHGTMDVCKHLLVNNIGYPADKIHFFKGWFQDTFPQAQNQVGDIAILRIDADWYASTKICLEYFYAKVVSGGVIIIDDYGTYDGCKKAVDEFISLNQLNVLINNVDDECIYWVKN